MINLTRYIITFIMSLMFTSVNLPFNMTGEDIKKQSSIGANKNIYWMLNAQFTLWYLFIFTNIYIKGEFSLALYEWILILIYTIGWLLRFSSYLTLGKYFKFNISISNDHKLIKTGPYKYLVHPSYAGGMIITTTSLLYFNIYDVITLHVFTMHILSFLLLINCIIICYFRCLEEEQFLSEEFGEKYNEYLKARWRIIPFIL